MSTEPAVNLPPPSLPLTADEQAFVADCLRMLRNAVSSGVAHAEFWKVNVPPPGRRPTVHRMVAAQTALDEVR